jgi:hypothetical protein
MRKMVLALTAFAAAATTAATQPPAADPKAAKQLRTYGIPVRARVFPQDSPQAALRSVITAIEQNEFGYLTAHLIDPAFVDERIEDRRRQLLPATEEDLLTLRKVQSQAPEKYDPSVRVPFDPQLFKERLADESRKRAFAQVVRDVQDKLTDDPQTLRDFRRFAKDATFPPAGGATTSKVALPDVKDRSLFFKNTDGRWFLENRQTDVPEKKEPEKKEP